MTRCISTIAQTYSLLCFCFPYFDILPVRIVMSDTNTRQVLSCFSDVTRVQSIIFSQELSLGRLLSAYKGCECCCIVFMSDSTKCCRDVHIIQLLKFKIVTNSRVPKDSEYCLPFSQSLPGCLFFFSCWRFSFLFQSHHFPEPLHNFRVSNLCSVFEFLSPHFLLR